MLTVARSSVSAGLAKCIIGKPYDQHTSNLIGRTEHETSGQWTKTDVKREKEKQNRKKESAKEIGRAHV